MPACWMKVDWGDCGCSFRAKVEATLIDTLTFVADGPTLTLEGRLQVMNV